MFEPFELQQQEILSLHTWTKQNPNLVAGFSTKSGGFSTGDFRSLNVGLHVHDNDEKVLLNRNKVANQLQFPLHTWICAEQIHGNQIMKVDKKYAGKGAILYHESIPLTDGLYTKEKNLLLVLCFADCVPLYFFSPKHEMIGIAHAGWQGTVKNIAGKMVATWVNEEKIDKNDIYAAIGPSIGQCCYVVDDRVINMVNDVLDVDDHVMPYQEISPGQYRLDLKQLNEYLLQKAGIVKENILLSSYCTFCEPSLFFSHRRDQGKTGRMMGFIGFKEV